MAERYVVGRIPAVNSVVTLPDRAVLVGVETGGDGTLYATYALRVQDSAVGPLPPHLSEAAHTPWESPFDRIEEVPL